MSFCIPSFAVNEFKLKLKSGELTPDKLIEMTSEERRAAFSFLGEEPAKKVNALFERKLLLKNQQQGIINWAKTVAGMDSKTYRDTLSKVERLGEVMQPKELDAFLEDLVNQRLGFDVTMAEAGEIASGAKEVALKREPMLETIDKIRAKIVAELPEGRKGDDGLIQARINKEAMNTKSELFKQRIEYGRALVNFNNKIEELKLSSQKITKEDFKQKPVVSTMQTISKIGGLSKSLVASLDNSILLNQGMKVLLNNPKIWSKNAKQTFVDMARTFGGKPVMDEIKAEVLSRPNAVSGLYKKEKLAVGTAEEAFPVSLQNKIPVVGRAFSASENAFTGFQYRTRADLFDKYYEIANDLGVDYTGIGRVANTLTGRGDLGRAEGSKVTETLNNVFFSPRYIMANLDTLSFGLRHYEKSSPLARKIAATNSLRIILGIGTILAIAKAVNPDSVEEDPRSSDFGKIRVGNTRFDVTGGLNGYATLGARLLPAVLGQKAYTKSATTGKLTQLNSGKFGSQTTFDVFVNFFSNKLAPVPALWRDILKGKDFSGEKVTPVSAATNLLTPLPIKTFQELQKDPNAANTIATMILNSLGINTSTFGK